MTSIGEKKGKRGEGRREERGREERIVLDSDKIEYRKVRR